MKQFFVGLAAISALLVSSISACACSHHQIESVEDSSSCHEHAAENKGEVGAAAAKESIASLSETGCVCPQIAPKISGKAETVKYEQHVAAVSDLQPATEIFNLPITAVKFVFAKPPYLSDSFYNLSPGRAPPVL